MHDLRESSPASKWSRNGSVNHICLKRCKRGQLEASGKVLPYSYRQQQEARTCLTLDDLKEEAGGPPAAAIRSLQGEQSWNEVVTAEGRADRWKQPRSLITPLTC